MMAQQYYGEAIAPELGVLYPFPPELEYKYPPPDPDILANVKNALIAVPRFYTQVLHLMNKMNLPAPFCAATPTPPLPPVHTPVAQPAAAEQVQEDISSSESELQSDEDNERGECRPREGEAGVQQKRLKKRKRSGGKHGELPSLEASGVKSVALPPIIKKKKPIVEIKLSSAKASLLRPRAEQLCASETLEKLPPGDVLQQHEEEEEEKGAADVAAGERPTAEIDATVMSGRMAAADIVRIPTFKDYKAGEPSNVLYIKNLAPAVTAEDMLHIFGPFFPTPGEAKQGLGIRVMQEGRMKGQAFVTWPSLELAQMALAHTHGCIVKGKPMVISFGRKAATKPPAAS